MVEAVRVELTSLRLKGEVSAIELRFQEFGAFARIRTEVGIAPSD